MKVGDRIYHKKYAGIATVIQVSGELTLDIRNKSRVIKTKYLAIYPDGRPITFYGYNIGKTIFKYENLAGEQMTIFDIINERKNR